MERIQLVIADVDGTLLTRDKTLTRRAKDAVFDLYDSQIHFTLTSGRPPRGMKSLIQEMALQDPIAAFNGGMIIRPDLSVIEQYWLSQDLVFFVLEKLKFHHLDAWIYRGQDWIILDRNAPHVEREQATVQFSPQVVSDLRPWMANVVKIVGVSDHPERLGDCAQDLQSFVGNQASISRSQPYYLDITHSMANKGTVVDRVSSLLSMDRKKVASLGDMPNDIAMFKRSALSIAMGNAPDEVKKAATWVTSSNEKEGFAQAVEKICSLYGRRIAKPAVV